MTSGVRADLSPEPPVSITRPVMHMGWHDLAYLHWPYRPADVAGLLPRGLRPDVALGSAWIGVIPFRMDRVRFGPLPQVPYVSSFPETNVRTYVVDGNGRRGIWFFSLDVNRLLPAVVARATYRLPYCWGPMSIERSGHRIRYEGRRRWPRATNVGSLIDVEVGDRIPDPEIDDLTHFLTAAWGLYSRLGSRVIWGPVDHPRWPLHEARVHEWRETLTVAAGLPPPVGDPLVHWSPGVQVRVGMPRAA